MESFLTELCDMLLLVLLRDERDRRLALGFAGDFTCSREVLRPLLPTLLRCVFIRLDWSVVSYVCFKFGFGLLLVVFD